MEEPRGNAGGEADRIFSAVQGAGIGEHGTGNSDTLWKSPEEMLAAKQTGFSLPYKALE